MRILFISRRYFPTVSGMSVYAHNLLRELSARGHDVTMISQYRGDQEGKEIYGGGPPPQLDGIGVIGLEAHGEQAGGDFERDIAEIVDVGAQHHERAPFDLVHAQYGYPPGLAALELSRAMGMPNVVSIQGGDGHWIGSCCGTHKRAMTAVLDHAGALLIGSRSFADEVTQRHGTHHSRFTIVPGATDTKRFRPAPRRTGDAGDLLYHGRVDARKGVFDLLDAFDLLRRDRSLRLTISGIGPDLERLRREVASRGLAGSVHFTGHVSYADAPAAYARGDVFVQATYGEGFSNTIVEAMASGIPIVATSAVGVTDCLDDEGNALLVPVGDVAALAGAITRLLNDPELRARLADRALADVLARYSWSVIATRIEAVYAHVARSAPDCSWHLNGDVEACRFRAAPHLL